MQKKTSGFGSKKVQAFTSPNAENAEVALLGTVMTSFSLHVSFS